MAKNESTAINDMIHLVHGRVSRPEPSGPEPADGLFVTAPPPPAKFVPVAAYFDPCALSAPVPRVAPMPPPLPRRRAPNATPPVPAQVQPIFHDDEDDEEETQIDPNALAAAQARFASPTPAPSARAVPTYPQPILPQYAYPTPAPLPPAPHVPGYDVTDRMPRQPQFLPTPAPVLAAVAPMSYPVVSRPSYDALETHRVAPLPPPPRDVPNLRPDLAAVAKRLALPFAGLAALVLAVVGVVMVVHHGQAVAGAADKAPEAPVVMAVTPPASAPAPVAAAPAPIVQPIESATPTVSATGDAIGWKPQTVQPTFVAAQAEPVSEPAPAVDEAEIEMDATPVARPSHRAKRRAVAVAARVAKPAAAKVAAPAAKPAKAAKKARVAAAAPRTDEDEITAAINAPTKTKSAATGTGPGKVTITSTPAALIYVDGRSLNQMTPKTLSLAPGQHKITLLELRSRKAKTQEIDVTAGGSLAVAKKF